MSTAPWTDPPKTGAGNGSAAALPNPLFDETFPSLRRAGPFVFFSGACPVKSDNIIAGATAGRGGAIDLDISTQTEICIENVRKILSVAGGGLEHLVELTTYLVDISDFSGYNEIYSHYFSHEGPARTTVAVTQLPHPHMLIEMKGVAYIAENESAHNRNGVLKNGKR